MSIFVCNSFDVVVYLCHTDCPGRFGTTVGGPVVFFLGGFIFAVVSALSALGDNNTSNALAFGLWYMVSCFCYSELVAPRAALGSNAQRSGLTRQYRHSF